VIVQAAPTARERRFKKIAFSGMWVFVLGCGVAGHLAMRALSQRLEWSNQIFFAAMAGFCVVLRDRHRHVEYVMFRRITAIREKARPSPKPLTPPVNR